MPCMSSRESLEAEVHLHQYSMKESDLKGDLASRYMHRLLPDDSAPRLHHIYDNPDKAFRMMHKSIRKFRNDSTLIQSKIDFEFLEKIRQTYNTKRERVRLPSLSPISKPSIRSHSTVPQRLENQLHRSKRSLSPTKPSESKLAKLDELISDYSTSTALNASSDLPITSKQRFADLKQKLEWAVDDEIGQFREIDVYYRYKNHEKRCNRMNFMSPSIARKVRRENVDMSTYISSHIGRYKLWKPSGESFPKRYELQIMKVDRQLDRLR
mmetsp:Transcript_14234/g.26857  ORF Transcript_14234/g.26857 Transcript_14234/m.26857 type:complete len:268 (-) Transcript_14234:1305-2108(-)